MSLRPLIAPLVVLCLHLILLYCCSAMAILNSTAVSSSFFSEPEVRKQTLSSIRYAVRSAAAAAAVLMYV